MSTKKTYTVEQLENAARILKSIAHPVKLEILKVLEDDILDVSTIAERLTMPCEISMLSHHLAKMKTNGVLQSNKIGKQVFYELVDKQILNIFSCVEKCKLI